MNKTIAIDVATKDEWGEVLSVTKAAYIEYAQHSDKAFWRSYEQSIEKTVMTDDRVVRLVARDNEKILGSVLFCPPYEKKVGSAFVSNPYPEMRLLAVPPSSRNRGLAAQLIDFCEEKARSEGYPTITLHTTVLMQTAKQMYERRGYIKYPEIDFEPVPGFVVWGYRKDFGS